jgi:DNA (cytosine-5)-methyltransferase 1
MDAETETLIPTTGGHFSYEPIALAENTIGRKPENGGNHDGFTEGGPMYTLNATGVHGVAQAIPIDTMNHIGRGDKHSMGDFVPSAPSYTLTKGHSHAVAQPIAFEPGKMKRLGHGDAKDGLTPTLRANAGDNQLAVAFPWQSALDPIGNPVDLSGTLVKNQTMACMTAMQVRRLSPKECERLQGFPDNYTDIKLKGKPTPDGPRYKALGNSMAVPVMAWIGKRIQEVEAINAP